MKHAPRSVTLLALTAALLAGCGSVEDRINKAIPVSKDVEVAKAALDKASQDLSSDRRKELAAQYQSQLKLRVLECSDGYTPSTFASMETIKDEIGNAECFVSADAKLRQWLGMRRAGLLAAMPPLRPVPAQPPAMLVATDRIQNAAVAEQAGVAVLQVGSRYELMDLTDGKTIHIGDQADGKPALSPNGRVIVSADDGEARLQDAETGEPLTTLSDVGAGRVYWANDKGLIYRKAKGKLAYFDWISGSESDVPLDSNSLVAVVSVPSQPDTFMLLGNERAATLRLNCKDKACVPELSQERKLPGSAIWAGNIGVVGGEAFFSGGQMLNRIQLDTLQSKSVSFDPMYLSEVIATRNPDTLIVKGTVRDALGGSNLYLYSIRNQTLAKIDTERLLSTRLFYAPALRSTMSIDGSKLVIANDLPTAPPVALESAISSMQFEAEAAKLEMLDRLQTLRAARESLAATSSQRSFPTAFASSDASAAVSRTFPAGEAGLTEAVRAGVLRLGNSGDVDAWKRSYLSHTGKSASRDFDDHIRMMKVYVITGDLVIPSGLAGANAVVFVLNRGTPYPRGNAGHSPILDVRSGSCGGSICGMILR